MSAGVAKPASEPSEPASCEATQDQERARLVAEAESWLGTPYHSGARLKGVGVDCLTIIAACFENAGLIEPVAIPHYPPDWHLHRAEERYLEGVLRYCVEVPAPPARAPLPGDLVLWRIGRAFAHGAIVTAWPMVIHADIRIRRVIRVDAEREPSLTTIGERTADHGKARPRRFFTLQRWASA